MMPREARIVIPELPHHIIQRGNRNQRVFFTSLDKKYYLDILTYYCQKERVEIWCYCLMDNHVHLIAVPPTTSSLARAIGGTHKKYTWLINSRNEWKGFLWQGRFLSYPMDEKYLYKCVRYIERNPVRAGIVDRAEDYPWSSARAHVFGYADKLLSPFYLLKEIEDWRAYLADEDSQEDLNLFEQNEISCQPLGSENFLKRLEIITGRKILRRPKGRPKGNEDMKKWENYGDKMR